jgi:type IV secretion system protein VirB2
MHTIEQTKNRAYLRFYLAFALPALAVFAIPDVAMATVGTVSPMGTVMCGIISIIYGNLGRGLATIGIISIGVMALLGKVSWGLAITVATGIGIIFGAVGLTQAILGWIDGTAGGVSICGGLFGIG